MRLCVHWLIGGGIIIVGEAAKRLSAAFKKRHAAVPWKNIAGFRDKAVHDYSAMNIAVVWDTVVEDLPFLYRELTKKDSQKMTSRKHAANREKRTR